MKKPTPADIVALTKRLRAITPRERAAWKFAHLRAAKFLENVDPYQAARLRDMAHWFDPDWPRKGKR